MFWFLQEPPENITREYNISSIEDYISNEILIIEEEILQKDISGSCPIDRIHVTTELHWEGYLESIFGDFLSL